MHDCGDSAELRRRLHEWFSRPLGQSLQALELNRLRDILPRLYGPTALQVGRFGALDMLEPALAANRIVLEQPPLDVAAGPRVRGNPEALPFDTKSIDLVLLPHTLEFSDAPHRVLAEAGRVLVPEGHIVILGFNPFSLWGLWRLCVKRRGVVPWCGRFFSLVRVKDWLELLGFSAVGGGMVYYRPPVYHEGLRDRLYFLEEAGDRWWPMIAAVYIVVARKRELGMTPLQPAWKTRTAAAPGLAEPARRLGAQGG